MATILSLFLNLVMGEISLLLRSLLQAESKHIPRLQTHLEKMVAGYVSTKFVALDNLGHFIS